MLWTTKHDIMVLRHWRVLTPLTSKCASRHNGVAFSMSQLPRLVQTWCGLTLFPSYFASRADFPHLNFQKSSEHGVSCTFLITSKCASRHNGVHSFHISTSKSRPRMVCFATVYFPMCFAPQRRALFPHLNLQKRPQTQVFWYFFPPLSASL